MRACFLTRQPPASRDRLLKEHRPQPHTCVVLDRDQDAVRRCRRRFLRMFRGPPLFSLSLVSVACPVTVATSQQFPDRRSLSGGSDEAVPAWDVERFLLAFGSGGPEMSLIVPAPDWKCVRLCVSRTSDGGGILGRGPSELGLHITHVKMGIPRTLTHHTSPAIRRVLGDPDTGLATWM